MQVYLFVVICKEVFEGKEKTFLLFDEIYPVLAKNDQDAISKATLLCAGDLEEAQEKADAEFKDLSYEIEVRPF